MQRLSSREVYRNPWMAVREDEVLRSDGSTGTYGVVDKADYVLVVPVDADGVWLVEQFRYAVGRRSWEFPQGSWPPGGSGTPLELARAELAEETGLRAAELRHLGHLDEAPGFCSQQFDVYVARGLEQGPTAREESEQDMQHRHVTRDELRRMIRAGELVDAASLAAWALLLLDEQA